MDKRTLRTHYILGNALAELLEEAPLHRITIRQITDRAGVAYSTFFRNFETIDDLLDNYTDDFLNEIQTLLIDIKIDNSRETTRENIRSIFKHILDNQTMYEMVLTSPALRPAFEAFKKKLLDRKLEIAQLLSPHFLADAPPIELMIHNKINSFINLVGWWLSQETPPEIELMIDYYEQIASFPMWRLVLGNDRAKQLLNIPLP